jgi:hypothetical protein
MIQGDAPDGELYWFSVDNEGLIRVAIAGFELTGGLEQTYLGMLE